MKKLILIPALIVLFSCNSQSHDSRWATLPIKISVDTEYQKDAVDFYNNLFEGVTFFLVSDDADAVKIENHDLSKEEISGYTKLSYDGSGVIESGEIWIDESVYDESVSRNLTAHELMHLLGYSHHDDFSGSLMKLNVPVFVSLDKIFGENLKQWLIDVYDLEVQ